MTSCGQRARGSQVWGKSADPNFFYFSRHVTAFAENSVGSSAPFVPLRLGRDQIVCEHRETLFDRIANL